MKIQLLLYVSLSAILSAEPLTELKLLSIGNSYTVNAHSLLRKIIENHGKAKAVIGMAPYQYLQQCRLSHAIRLLRNEKQLQIQQIAAECGFGNTTEFSRFFKKQTGLSPLNYSKNFFE